MPNGTIETHILLWLGFFFFRFLECLEFNFDSVLLLSIASQNIIILEQKEHCSGKRNLSNEN